MKYAVLSNLWLSAQMRQPGRLQLSRIFLDTLLDRTTSTSTEKLKGRSGSVWRRNYASLTTFEEQVLEVMHDQQLLVYSEAEARRAYPDLVIASLGAQRKEKPGGKVTARVLFDGTHGLCVNTRTRLRDQERAPIAADLKRTMREKAKLDELTFASSADVSEAHRQVPIHPDDWQLLGCQLVSGREVFINTVGTTRRRLPSNPK